MLSKAEIVGDEQTSSSGAKYVVVKVDEKFYAVSSVVAYDTGKFETLAFPCDEKGENRDSVCAGGIGRSREEVIAQLERGEFNDNYEELAEELGGVGGILGSVLESMKREVLGG